MSNFALQIDCQAAPATAKSDAGIAGAGVILAFIITAGLALIASSFIVISEIRGRNSRNISRKILSGLSDQMLVEGIAIQVVGLARIYSTIPYHFFIIWMLSLLSTATNFAALLALVQDLKRDWVLRWLRQFAMFVNMVLGITFGIFILKTNVDKLAPTLPMACVWQAHQQDGAAQGNQALSIVGTSVVIAAACIIFVLGTWYLHLRRQIWGKTVRLMSLIVLMAIAIGGKFCTRRVYLLFKKLIICTSHCPSDPHSSSIGRHAVGESCGSRRNRMDLWSALDDATLDPALYLGIGDLQRYYSHCSSLHDEHADSVQDKCKCRTRMHTGTRIKCP